MWVRILSGNLAGKLRQVADIEAQNLISTGFARAAAPAEYTLFDSHSAESVPKEEVAAFARAKQKQPDERSAARPAGPVPQEPVGARPAGPAPEPTARPVPHPAKPAGGKGFFGKRR